MSFGTQHVSAGFEVDDDGFIMPVCSCGFSWGPCPDMEVAVDVLMEHAYLMGFADAATVEQ